MTDQDKINRAIADALTAQGFEEGLTGKTQYRCNARHIMDRRSKHQECLYMHRISFDVRAACLLPTVEVFVPHDFANPTYLIPALEEYAKRFVIFRIDTYRARHDGQWNGFLGVDYGNSNGDHKGRETFPARGASYCEALRNAFHAALGAAAE